MIGDKVHTTGSVNVRQSPSLSGLILMLKPAGYSGVIFNGPAQAGGHVWWQINYDQGSDGWTSQVYLAKGSVTPPTSSGTPRPATSPSASPKPGNVGCIHLTYRLSRGATDARTARQVSVLQKILMSDTSGYTAGVTGYFGSLTETGVQKFQAKYGIVSVGTPATTGYGSVGPQTRVKLNEKCRPGSSSPISLISPNGGETLVIGKSASITWQSDATSSKPWVALFLEPGDIFLRQGLTASSTYQWDVPNTYCYGNICGYQLFPGNNYYKIEARLYTGPLLCLGNCLLNTPQPTLIGKDQSDNPFTIATSTPK